MNDPHVTELHYRIKHHDGVDYDQAGATTYPFNGFAIELDGDKAVAKFTDHYATTESARGVVDPILRAWEIDAGLQHRPDEISFEFMNPVLIDRAPDNRRGHTVVEVGTAQMVLTGGTVKIKMSRSQYPPPPEKFELAPVVEQAYAQYTDLVAERQRLGPAAYHCLTIAQDAGARALGWPGNKRQAAADYFAIARDVLEKFMELSTNRGGSDARKSVGAAAPYTTAEREWITDVLKKLIRRLGERAYSPTATLDQITMADLPPLT